MRSIVAHTGSLGFSTVSRADESPGKAKESVLADDLVELKRLSKLA